MRRKTAREGKWGRDAGGSDDAARAQGFHKSELRGNSPRFDQVHQLSTKGEKV